MGCWRSLYLQLQRLCHSFCPQGSGLNSSWASEHGWGGINHLVFEVVMNIISMNNTSPLQLSRLTWGPKKHLICQKYFLSVQPILFRILCAVLFYNVIPSALLPSKSEFMLPCLRGLWLIFCRQRDRGHNTDQDSWEFFSRNYRVSSCCLLAFTLCVSQLLRFWPRWSKCIRVSVK